MQRMRLTNIGVFGYLHSSFECLRPETINTLPKKTTIQRGGELSSLGTWSAQAIIVQKQSSVMNWRAEGLEA